MEIWEQLELVNSKESLADFVSAIHFDLRDDRSDWANTRLDLYLEAIEAIIRSRNGEYSPNGKAVASLLSWKEIAKTLFYAARYE
jgi:hypothetical protein